MSNAKKFQGNWDAIFKNNHLYSWPSNSLKIANHQPGNYPGTRNIFKEDEKEIMTAAKNHGFIILNNNKHSVDFIKK